MEREKARHPLPGRGARSCAAGTKLAEAVERLGCDARSSVPFDDVVEGDGRSVTIDGLRRACSFIPVCDPNVIAGNGTIGLEILEDLPDVDTVVVPFGGGGLSCGVASAIRAVRPETRILAGEVETAAPLDASLRAGRPQPVEYRASFVDGIGGKCVLDPMWPLVRDLLDGSIVVSLGQVTEAIRLLASRNRVIAEGAGACSVAAALTGSAPGDKIVCVVSGGNIDVAKLAAILDGRTP